MGVLKDSVFDVAREVADSPYPQVGTVCIDYVRSALGRAGYHDAARDCASLLAAVFKEMERRKS